ncbi:MAG: hypothetical protein NTU88_13835 [Armatimonadetes bacterium]|nr:hypothetical protein [Armatimonadota bacterium]
MSLTRAFWSLLGTYDVIVSDLVTAELARVGDSVLRERLLRLASPFRVVGGDQLSEELAIAYVSAGAFPSDYADDSRHVGIAVANGAGFLVSWNFRHIVKVRTRRIVELVNAQRGLPILEIVAPPEL